MVRTMEERMANDCSLTRRAVRMVIDIAKVLDAAFRCKSDSAQYQVVRRFVAAHGLVYRVHTHVGIAKPLKDRVRRQHSTWMMQQCDGAVPTQFSPPSRSNLASWVVESIQELPRNIVVNSCRHGDYSYFAS
jgi:hypothetical protein